MTLHQLATLSPISLAELSAESALLSRVDRKYFVPRAIVEDLIAEYRDEARVLEIGGRRNFTYETVYYDSPEFGFYRAHAQGRRQRYKVRVRTYLESGLRMLEVKSKGFRGRTLKERITHAANVPVDQLGSVGEQFVDGLIGGGAAELKPVLTTVYRRSTLALGDQRITLDLALECQEGEQVFYGPDDVLVETKSPSQGSAFDAALRARGIRPHTVSKYCVAASLLYPRLPRNRWNRTIRRFFPGGDRALARAA